MGGTEVLFHPEASEEFASALRWYEDQTEGLGGVFRQEVESAVEIVRRNPERWPLVRSAIRRVLLHRFPYALLYSKSGARIWILAVAHLRRRPGYWEHRRPPSSP